MDSSDDRNSWDVTDGDKGYASRWTPPPNLSPVEELLDCGVGDLGDVTPITDDRINPEYEWPELRYFEELAVSADEELG
ncbi:hypothetical protein [Halorussus salinisoli]|uniref:hypothetical protein n=1 Tax=Halorussus salinisoli TaxID=2558242 RepID=UPI0014856C31|nr:hypothetical protein [Halorussus salinisoli]